MLKLKKKVILKKKPLYTQPHHIILNKVTHLQLSYEFEIILDYFLCGFRDGCNVNLNK